MDTNTIVYLEKSTTLFEFYSVSLPRQKTFWPCSYLALPCILGDPIMSGQLQVRQFTPGIKLRLNMRLKWPLVSGSPFPALYASKYVQHFCLQRKKYIVSNQRDTNTLPVPNLPETKRRRKRNKSNQVFCCCLFLQCASVESYTLAQDTFAYTLVKECGQMWPRPAPHVVWVTFWMHLTLSHLYSELTTCDLIIHDAC